MLSKYDDCAVLIWTTTPWTIPANMALAVHGDFEYSVVKVPQGASVNAKHLLVVTDRVPAVQEALCAATDTGEAPQLEVLDTVSGAALAAAGIQCIHPLFAHRRSIVFAADHVTADSGTGCACPAPYSHLLLPCLVFTRARRARGSIVHTAPGHGHEDFEAAKGLGLEPLCPVDDEGRFTAEAGEQFQGLAVQTDGNAAVLQVRALAAAVPAATRHDGWRVM